MEVRFLGVGAALPSPGQTNCSYVIHLPGVQLLFDCGPAILQQLAAVNLSPGDITHLFISHRHGDHILGSPMFLLWRVQAQPPGGQALPVIASSATLPALKTLWDLVFPDAPNPPVEQVELPAEEPGHYQLTPNILLRTWPMIHSDQVPVLGLRIETQNKILAFTADSAAHAAILELAWDADLLVADARYAATVSPASPHPRRTHSSALEIGRLAQQARVKRLALVHLGAEYDGAQEALVQEARTVFSGEVFAPVAGQQIRV